MTPAFPFALFGEDLPRDLDAEGVHPCGRLIEKQQLRVQRQCLLIGRLGCG